MFTPIYQGGHMRQCSRKAVKDGYCKQHHPDEVKKRGAHREKKLETTPLSFFVRSRHNEC
jgi:hypothetical protein